MPKDKEIICPKCGSEKIEKYELDTPNAPYIEIIYVCEDCKEVFQDTNEEE